MNICSMFVENKYHERNYKSTGRGLDGTLGDQ